MDSYFMVFVLLYVANNYVDCEVLREVNLNQLL
jgi:hypothetical protein